MLDVEIAIIGGGITGLSTAVALKQQGLPCQVYERAEELNEVGAGIGLAPNAMLILDRLGLADSLRSLGEPVGEMAVTNAQLHAFLTSGTPKGLSARHQTVFIHRARLQERLYQACAPDQVQLGAPYEGHRVEGGKICVKVGGKERRVDLLVGADGIHSAVRRRLFPSSKLRYSGQTCWRGVVKRTLPRELVGKVREAWGAGIRFGFGQIGQGEVYWFAVQKAAPGGKDEATGLVPRLCALFSDFHPIVRELIEHTLPEKIIRSDIHDLGRLSSWSQGAVALLGDAAHATTPNMGQGACQGIEDAWYFSHALARCEGIAQALEHFERSRRKKVDYVVNNSWRLGQAAHSRFGRTIMRGLMTVMPQTVAEKQMLRLVQVDEFDEGSLAPV